MKKLLILLFVLPFTLFAQKNTIQHTVVAKESFSSIGRLYNINGRELANFNKIDYEKGLAIGQVLNVPVTTTAKTNTPVTIKEKVVPVIVPEKQKVQTTTSNNSIAIKHTVAKKETLYGVSKMYNTTVADIKKWNNLTIDALSEGAEIIVGYKVGAAEIIKQPDAKVVAKTPVKVVEEVKEKPIVKEEAVVKKVPIATPKPVVEANIENEDAKDFKGGYFKSDFENTGITENGTAGIFKSTSGWEDGKYYCLHNNASSGTIVKITNKANGKYVYAKVLDLMPDLKQNNTLKVRISNAAANILEADSGNFECSINY
ncbi:MAG: LysM peptidoglycan-binding domain-containing protein [Ferruginibacter sp.]|nr:LysM peptidoglycan-binding domain-containing protein [Ferruginibacter sp.]